MVKQPSQTKLKKKVKKNISTAIAHVNSSFNNTLITITDYSGNDPEVNTFGSANVARGTDFLSQGLNRNYKFGVNFKF